MNGVVDVLTCPAVMLHCAAHPGGNLLAAQGQDVEAGIVRRRRTLVGEWIVASVVGVLTSTATV